MVDLLLSAGAVSRVDAVAILVRLQVPPRQQGNLRRVVVGVDGDFVVLISHCPKFLQRLFILH